MGRSLVTTDRMVVMYSHIYSQSMDQPGKVANPARGQLNRENEYSLSVFAPENLVSRVTTGRMVVLYGHAYSKSMDQPGKVANPARGQLNREKEYLPIRVRA